MATDGNPNLFLAKEQAHSAQNPRELLRQLRCLINPLFRSRPERTPTLERQEEAGKTAKGVDAKSDNLRSIPRTQTVEGLPQVVL